jgi:hypothetical protein
MALIFCPFVVLTAVPKILEPVDDPDGDMRNSVAFRLAFCGAFIVVAGLDVVASARWLLADRRRR